MEALWCLLLLAAPAALARDVTGTFHLKIITITPDLIPTLGHMFSSSLLFHQSSSISDFEECQWGFLTSSSP